jgi:hypothetical protein
LRGQQHIRLPFELFLTRLMAQEFLKSFSLLELTLHYGQPVLYTSGVIDDLGVALRFSRPAYRAAFFYLFHFP